VAFHAVPTDPFTNPTIRASQRSCDALRTFARQPPPHRLLVRNSNDEAKRNDFLRAPDLTPRNDVLRIVT